MTTTYTDLEICAGLAAGDRSIYEFVFRKYYTPLCRFCLKFVRQEALSEEVVQEVFVYIWEKRDNIRLESSLQAYLYAAVRNRSINYLRKQITQAQHLEVYHQEQDIYSGVNEEGNDREELYNKVRLAIEKLPEKCQLIFNLSRVAGLTYAEIAEEMEISPKTVEAQMSIAFKKLRAFMGAYNDRIFNWVLIVLLLWKF